MMDIGMYLQKFLISYSIDISKDLVHDQNVDTSKWNYMVHVIST